LLTDGINAQLPGRLDSAIKQCEGVFRCGCRGVGTNRNVDELSKISTALLGTVDIVPDPAGLAAGFEAMMAESMAKQVPDVALRVWTPQHATVRFVRQVAPTVGNLAAIDGPAVDVRAADVRAAPRARDYLTGAWGNESRDYHLSVEVEPAAAGQEMLAARGQSYRQYPVGPGGSANSRPGTGAGDLDRRGSCPPESTATSLTTPGNPNSPMRFKKG
jgi:hypothetical protein